MSIGRDHNRPRLALTGVVAVLLAGGCGPCGQYTQRIHDFSAPKIEVGPGIQVSVSTSGFWTTNTDGSVTSGADYVVSVRVWGTGTEVAVASMEIRDPRTGEAVVVDDWQPAVRDPSDSSMLLVDRSGVGLSHSSKEIVGELRVGRGDEIRTYAFADTLHYEYREERKNRFWQRLMGV